MNPFVTFMSSTAGRIARIAAGLALIAWGLWGLGGTAGIVVAIVGLVPLLAGARVIRIVLRCSLPTAGLEGGRTARDRERIR